MLAAENACKRNKGGNETFHCNAVNDRSLYRELMDRFEYSTSRLSSRYPAYKKILCNYLSEAGNDSILSRSTNPENAPSPPFAISFDYKNSNVLAIAAEEGTVSFMKVSLESEPPQPIHTFRAHKNAIFDFKWIQPSSNQFLTCSGDQSIALWDIENLETPIALFHGHSSSVKTLSAKSANVFASGGRDGAIYMWDNRTNNKTPSNNRNDNRNSDKPFLSPIQTILDNSSCSHTEKRKPRGIKLSTFALNNQSHQRSITSIAFLPYQNHLLASASVPDNQIKMWDVRYHKKIPIPSSTIQIPFQNNLRNGGISCISTDSAGNRIFAVATDHNIYSFPTSGTNSTVNTTTDNPYIRYHSPLLNISSYFIKAEVCPNDQVLLCGSGAATHVDGTSSAALWLLEDPTNDAFAANAPSNGAEITSVAWNHNSNDNTPMFATACDDSLVRLWKFTSCNQDSSFDSNDEHNSTQTPLNVKYSSINPVKIK